MILDRLIHAPYQRDSRLPPLIPLPPLPLPLCMMSTDVEATVLRVETALVVHPHPAEKKLAPEVDVRAACHA